jgi:hypothetical protein
MKDYDDMTEHERDVEVLRTLVQLAKDGEPLALRGLGEMLGITKGRRVPSFDEIRERLSLTG